jgi:hypothetical protein
VRSLLLIIPALLFINTLVAQQPESPFARDSAFLKNDKKYAIQYYQNALKDFTTALKLCEGINNREFIPEKYISLGAS